MKRSTLGARTALSLIPLITVVLCHYRSANALPEAAAPASTVAKFKATEVMTSIASPPQSLSPGDRQRIWEYYLKAMKDAATTPPDKALVEFVKENGAQAQGKPLSLKSPHFNVRVVAQVSYAQWVEEYGAGLRTPLPMYIGFNKKQNTLFLEEAPMLPQHIAGTLALEAMRSSQPRVALATTPKSGA